MPEIYDYIIVGAGSSGCVMAGRLSENPRNRILVIEAGGRDSSPFVTMPKGIAKLVSDPAHTWFYNVAQPRLPGAPPSEVWIRGRVLGGSSSINGMIWSRGQPADYDAWEAMGATGWNWQSMKAAFRSVEDHALGDDGTRGVGGPVKITPGTYRYPLTEDMMRAGEQMGLPRHQDDLNREDLEGIGFYAHNIHKGRRQSSAKTFLEPAVRRGNVRVVTGATVEKVLFEGNRATGVRLTRNGRTEDFNCTGEVIVSGGTIESPKLLQRSGIGNGEHLRAAGVAVVAESPDVGQHMREHLCFSVPHRLKPGHGSINRQYFGVRLALNVARYFLTRTGPLASGPFEIGGFAKSRPHLARPDLQLFLGAYNFALGDDQFPVPLANIDKQPGITVYGQLSQLTSEGTVAIVAPDAASPATISPNWLSTNEDVEAALGSIRVMRQLMAQPALAQHIESELVPGAHVQSDEDLLQYYRALSTSGLHGTGTCRMGSDERAVVDPHCRVRGVQGLRVIDCSVMPGLVTGNTNAPAMAAAWHLADLMKTEAA